MHSCTPDVHLTAAGIYPAMCSFPRKVSYEKLVMIMTPYPMTMLVLVMTPYLTALDDPVFIMLDGSDLLCTTMYT